MADPTADLVLERMKRFDVTGPTTPATRPATGA